MTYEELLKSHNRKPRKPRKPRQHPEANLQKKVVRYCRLRKWWTLKGNYEGKTQGYGGQFENDMGYQKGSPDLEVMTPTDTYYFEFKSAKGRQTPEQKDFQEMCRQTGRKYYIVREYEEFLNIFETK
jgi:hypothetical protein